MFFQRTPKNNLTYTVIDLETTGLFAGGTDRIVEIAMVQVDSAGQITQTFETLINPERDLGPTHIHGIAAKQVLQAPKFAEIAGDIAHFIKGSVPVAHNAIFDSKFITAEFNRLAYDTTVFHWVCTLKSCSKFVPDIASRKLADCCDYFDIPLKDAHKALNDANATALLLQKLLSQTDSAKWSEYNKLESDYAHYFNYPEILETGKKALRSDTNAPDTITVSGLSKVINRLPAGQNYLPVEQQYLDFLDKALLDRKITHQEIKVLSKIAESLELSQAQVNYMHQDYLRDLFLMCWSDGILSDVEKKDLKEVQALLCIDDISFKQISAEVKNKTNSTTSNSKASAYIGKTFCFTGEFQHILNGKKVSRKTAEESAQQNGLIVRNAVTKSLDYLVSADPDSLSGKAAKARKYEIPILPEAAFWQIILF